MTDKEVEEYRSSQYKFYTAVRNALAALPPRSYELDKLHVYIDPLDATQEFTGR